jgi:hypothetical protein
MRTFRSSQTVSSILAAVYCCWNAEASSGVRASSLIGCLSSSSRFALAQSITVLPSAINN